MLNTVLLVFMGELIEFFQFLNNFYCSTCLSYLGWAKNSMCYSHVTVYSLKRKV